MKMAVFFEAVWAGLAFNQLNWTPAFQFFCVVFQEGRIHSFLHSSPFCLSVFQFRPAVVVGQAGGDRQAVRQQALLAGAGQGRTKPTSGRT